MNRAYLLLLLLAITVLLFSAHAADAQFTQEFNDTVNNIRDTISYLSNQVTILKDKLDNKTEEISKKISANVQAVEDRVQDKFDQFVDDAKAIASGFIIAICASFVGVFVCNILFELGIWYCRKRFLNRAAAKRVKAKVEPATAAVATDNPAKGLLQRKGWAT
jgi:predicted PurR-regulated permease PerM